MRSFSKVGGTAVRLRRGVLSEAVGIRFFGSVLWCGLNPPVPMCRALS